jgi:hypothetical protein
MYMLFTKFENYTYWHLHSTYDTKEFAVETAKTLVDAKNFSPKIVQCMIVPIGDAVAVNHG